MVWRLFLPRLGTVQECNTSAVVTIIQIGSLLVVQFDYLYLVGGMYLLVCLVVLYMNRFLIL